MTENNPINSINVPAGRLLAGYCHRALLTGVLVALIGGGCIRSVNPILRDEQVVLNKDVLGKWVSSNGNDTIDVQEAESDASHPEKTYKVTYTENNGKKAPLEVRLGKIGDVTLAEIHAADPLPDASDIYKGHVLRLYSAVLVRELGPKRLVFSVVGGKVENWLKSYLATHPGELQLVDDSTVSSRTEDFQAFLLRHIKDNGLLGDDVTMVRPGDPSTKPAE